MKLGNLKTNMVRFFGLGFFLFGAHSAFAIDLCPQLYQNAIASCGTDDSCRNSAQMAYQQCELTQDWYNSFINFPYVSPDVEDRRGQGPLLMMSADDGMTDGFDYYSDEEVVVE